MKNEVTVQKKSTPKLRHHKVSRQGYVVLNHKAHYLGRYGLPETERKYHQVIAEWIASGQQVHVEPG